MEGFIKYIRSEEAVNLHSNKTANHLLNVIAFRASRKGNPVLGVKPGEAFIGDFKKIGLTHREYRSAITNLVKWGYITTTTTNRGTIAKLCNSDVYDINSDLFDKQTTSQRQTKDKQETTIKKERNKELINKNDSLVKKKPILSEDVAKAFVRIFGKEQEQVSNIIKAFNIFTAGITLEDTSALMQVAKFKCLDFEKYKYKMHDDTHIKDSLFKFLMKEYQYSNRKQNAALSKQDDYAKYLLDWAVDYYGEKEGTFKYNYWKKRNELEKWVNKYNENKNNLLSIYKEHFKEYSNLTLYTLFEVLHLNLWNKTIKTTKSIPNTIKEFKGWLKRSSKKNNYKINRIHMRTNIYNYLDSTRL